MKEIQDIDASKQTFTVSYFCYYMWEPTAEDMAGFAAETSDALYNPAWRPTMALLNMVEEISEVFRAAPGSKRYHLLSAESPPSWGATCYMPAEFPYLIGYAEEKTVSCRCTMDLHAYPFDSQNLHMMYEAGSNITKMRLNPNVVGFDNGDGQEDPFTLYVEGGQLVPEYQFHRPCVEFHVVDNHDQFIISLNVLRYWQGKFWSVVLPTLLFTMLGLMVFAVDPKSLTNRLSLIFTMLLTLVAFQFAIQGADCNVVMSRCLMSVC